MSSLANFPKKMKAAILVEQKKPLIIDEIEMPTALEVGQVLVKIHFSGICGSQIGEIDGAKGEDKYLPHLLGHEASATVLAMGPGVRNVKVDDTVVLHWRKGAGIESAAPAYRWKGQKLNAGWITTFNDYAVISENRMTTIPDRNHLEIASLFGCAVTTGFGVIENNARLRIGESVVIYGAGGVGLNMVQAASLVSAYPVIAVDLHDHRLALAKKMGATHLINASKENAREAIAAIVGKAGLDVFVDNTGLPETIETGYGLTHGRGRVILVGVPKKGQDIKIHSLPLHFGKVLTGSHGGEAMPQTDIPRYYQHFLAGQFSLQELLTQTYTLDNINEAISDMRSGQSAGRCLIRM